MQVLTPMPILLFITFFLLPLTTHIIGCDEYTEAMQIFI
jgi:hypothetical protein